MTLCVYDDRYLGHRVEGHPECPERLTSIVTHLRSCGLWDKLTHLPPRSATPEEITLIHSPKHVRSIQEACASGGGWVDADTYLLPSSYEIARLAAGGVLAACEAILAKKDSTALCLVRPPGHHATPTRAMGFCLFHNVAIAAQFVRQRGIERVLIVDWDVHHGNGTQDAFYEDDTVLYLSTHRYPFYPGTGSAAERGQGRGEGFTVNLPLSGGTPRRTFLETFEREVKKAADSFRPEMVFISCGFDAYERDPIGGLGLQVEDYRTLTDIVMEVAHRWAQGRAVSVLEGGYNLQDLGRMCEAHLRGLMG